MVIIGAGQAGLAVSHELTRLGVEHVVLERGRVAQTWRDRWDSFCLVTPNWSVQLPGGAYVGPDPDGFMSRDALVRHLESYGRSFAAPVREGVTVRSLDGGTRWSTAARHHGRPRARLDGDRLHRSLPAGASAPRGRDASSLAPDARRRKLSEPRTASARQGADRRQRADRLSARGGAARGGPRRVPRLRSGAVGAAQSGRARHRAVVRRDLVSRAAGLGAPLADGAADREPAGHRPRWRT